MESVLVHVVKFLRVEDMVRLNGSRTVWDHFWFWYCKRCKEKDYLNALKRVYYNNSRRAIVSYCIAQNWSKFSVNDQMQILCTRKHIMYYFIAIVVKHGRSIVYKYNKYIDSLRTKTKQERRARMKWMISSWQILKGSRNDIFRRQALFIK